MTDMSKLWYYIHGKLKFSFVSISPDETIVELKKIHNDAPNSFTGRDALDLTLTVITLGPIL